MNTHHDDHALSHQHRANPITVVREAIAASENALLHSMDLHEDIQHLAYHLWVAAGKPGGDEVHFWLKAEQEPKMNWRGEPSTSSLVAITTSWIMSLKSRLHRRMQRP